MTPCFGCPIFSLVDKRTPSTVRKPLAGLGPVERIDQVGDDGGAKHDGKHGADAMGGAISKNVVTAVRLAGLRSVPWHSSLGVNLTAGLARLSVFSVSLWLYG